MIIKENIKDVSIANTRISKILSGGGIIWEKEKVYKIVWSKVGSTDSDDKDYNDFLYKSYQINKGNIIPVEKIDYGLWGSLFYYIRGNQIKKIEFSHYRQENVPGGYRQIMIFNIYTGKIVGEYR